MKTIPLRSLLAGGLLAAALLFPARSQAQLTFTLDSSSLNGLSGQTLSFSGSLFNQGSTTVFLNGNTFTLTGTGLTLDDSPFLTNAPLSLAGGERYAGQLFNIDIAPNAPSQFAAGSFSIVGGQNDSAQNNLATQNFQVSVNAPEPATLPLIALGVASGAGFLLRRRVTSSRAVAIAFTPRQKS